MGRKHDIIKNHLQSEKWMELGMIGRKGISYDDIAEIWVRETLGLTRMVAMVMERNGGSRDTEGRTDKIQL